MSNSPPSVPLDTSECSLLEGAIFQGVLKISGSTGSTYLGILASAIVYGITCLQAFHYYRSQKAKSDHLGLKVLVAFLMFSSTLQEVFIAFHGYYYLVLLVSDPCRLLEKLLWYFPAESIITGILEFTVEIFLVHRVYRLSHNVFITAICALLILAGSVFTIAIPSRVLASNDVGATALIKERPLGLINTGLAALGEACTTASMWYYLHQSRTGFRRSDSLVTRLIQLTVSTGALTVLISSGEFLSWLTSNIKVSVTFFTFLTGKVYVNALITTLNMREVLDGSSRETSTQGVNSIHLSRIPPFRTAKATKNQQNEVAVDTVVELGRSGKEANTVVLRQGRATGSSLSSIEPESPNDSQV